MQVSFITKVRGTEVTDKMVELSLIIIEDAFNVCLTESSRKKWLEN